MTSDFTIPDGIGIVMASKVLTRMPIEQITGSDLHEMIIIAIYELKGSCFYLGLLMPHFER